VLEIVWKKSGIESKVEEKESREKKRKKKKKVNKNNYYTCVSISCYIFKKFFGLPPGMLNVP
jgi:hypothetical protein